jgi:hypothetical protein
MVVILVSGKVDFKQRDKEGHFIVIKGAMPQEEITIVNLYAPNVCTCKYIKHTLMNLKAQIAPNTVVLRDFNRSPRQNINKETIHQMGLTDIYRWCCPTTEQYTFFSAAYGTFSNLDHILGHKAILNKCKKIAITLHILFHQNTIKLEINNKETSEYTQTPGDRATHCFMISGS